MVGVEEADPFRRGAGGEGERERVLERKGETEGGGDGTGGLAEGASRRGEATACFAGAVWLPCLDRAVQLAYLEGVG
eukprot:COSAG02_NODE_336_length_24344_cov_63.239101_13_plen_77_part_00